MGDLIRMRASHGPIPTSAPDGADGRLPDFIIIGAMRSATTGLYRALGHPEIDLAPTKEIHFFDAQFDRGVHW